MRATLYSKKVSLPTAMLLVCLSSPRGSGEESERRDAAPAPARGTARAEVRRPERFPHRIWAACDFEGQTRDYGWFGTPVQDDIPAYAGNRTALRGGYVEAGDAVHAGVNPVPGPRMGKHNKVYFRYRLEGGRSAQVQHFNLTREDNHHIVVSGLDEGKWSELTLDFTRDSLRNDGSPGAMVEGDRMDDLKVFVGRTGSGRGGSILLDDIILFADDPELPPDPEPFPRRVIFLAAFDTGEKEKYWPGDLEITGEGTERPAPAGTWWRAARAVPRKDGKGKLVSLQITPVRPVGADNRLRFRYHLRGARSMVVQIFDATVMDNRHVRLEGLEEGAWRTARIDFTRDSRRNDGSQGTFAAGNVVDDIFFFVEPQAGDDVELYVDEVVLYDAGDPPPKE